MTRRNSLLAGGLIVLAVLAAYASSFSSAFVSDDLDAIVDNPTIRELWPIGPVLAPPHDAGQTVGGRPLVNLSLALNYAVGGLDPWGYHAVNLAIHALAALVLFGCVRRTLERVKTPAARAIALAAALPWALHPLQTESITYVVQRAESMMGLFYLLTLYCFIRYAEHRNRLWFGFTILACLAGMATKEVMVSAPVMVLLYDRIFVSGSFREAWRRHRGILLGLASGWLLLGALVLANGNRGGSMGFGLGVSWGAYVWSQLPAIAHYLRLALWPYPLIFDYGVAWNPSALQVAAAVLVVGALAVGTAWAFRVRPWAAFLGLWFFAILAPTSLIPANRFTLAEHRMYLALAPLAVAAAIGINRLAGRWLLATALGLSAVYGAATVARNRDYRSAVGLWSDTVARLPTNAFAQDQLGSALAATGSLDAAIAHYETALRLDPALPQTRFNLANTFNQAGRPEDAIAQYEAALRLKPAFPECYDNLASTLADHGRIPEAIERYEQALRLRPNFPLARNNLGNALAKAGRTAEAITQYEEALRQDPGLAEADYDLGNALMISDRVPEAIDRYEACLRLQPDHARAHHNLGVALRAIGRPEEAEAQLEIAARLKAANHN